MDIFKPGDFIYHVNKKTYGIVFAMTSGDDIERQYYAAIMGSKVYEMGAVVFIDTKNTTINDDQFLLVNDYVRFDVDIPDPDSVNICTCDIRSTNRCKCNDHLNVPPCSTQNDLVAEHSLSDRTMSMTDFAEHIEKDLAELYKDAARVEQAQQEKSNYPGTAFSIGDRIRLKLVQDFSVYDKGRDYIIQCFEGTMVHITLADSPHDINYTLLKSDLNKFSKVEQCELPGDRYVPTATNTDCYCHNMSPGLICSNCKPTLADEQLAPSAPTVEKKDDDYNWDIIKSICE